MTKPKPLSWYCPHCAHQDGPDYPAEPCGPCIDDEPDDVYTRFEEKVQEDFKKVIDP